MQIISAGIPDIKIIQPRRIADGRGYFSETFRKDALLAAGLSIDFVQDNQSLSTQRGVVRGLHYQIPPRAQTKLIRVLRGAIFDVAVDLRRGSATFGRHVGVVISAQDWNQILIPRGFAHGFATLEPNTEVAYKVDDYWSREHERGLLWNDPELDIPWPVSPSEVILSEKDQRNPRLAELVDFF
jgi:dTDP-4-dehydrorhamnose 3,5-epimerase